MQMKHLAIVASAVAALTAGVAQAHTVSLQGITATWFGGDPAANVSYNSNGTTTPEARWGIGDPQSGYNYVVANQPINFDVPPDSPNQVLGSFTHLNNPISSGSSITSIKLGIKADIYIDAAYQGTLMFNYGFDHWETDNGATTCANGDANGVGVNKNGCADRVIANWLSTSQDFYVDSDIYTLNVKGFSLTQDGLNPFTEFWTAESEDNQAYLIGNVALRSSVELPEPDTLALVALALLGAGLAGRRRRS
jgi:MYXO-CTERM domain-containing protein